MTAEGLTVPELPSRTIIVLVVAVFVVALGYGVVLPVLPAIVAKIAGTGDAAAVARHLGYLSAVYAAGPLVAAVAWGRLSDARGRGPVITFALWGFAITLVATAFAPTLFALYVGRALNGLFAAAVLPTVLALIADLETNDDRRARLFGRVSMASIAGFFLGPMLGGFAAHWGAGVLLPGGGPFLLVGALAGGMGIVVALFVPDRARVPTGAILPLASPSQARRRILVLTGIVACGLGALEVGVAMRTGPRADAGGSGATVRGLQRDHVRHARLHLFSMGAGCIGNARHCASARRHGAWTGSGTCRARIANGVRGTFTGVGLGGHGRTAPGLLDVPGVGHFPRCRVGNAECRDKPRALGSASVGALYGFGGTEWAAFLVPATVVLVGGMLAISLPRVLAKAALPVSHASTHRADLGQERT